MSKEKEKKAKSTSSNKYIKKGKKKKKSGGLILGFFIVIVGVLVFVYKSPIFSLKKINIKGLVTVTNASLQDKLKYYIGKNIFTVDYKEIEKDLKTNPYIETVKVSKGWIDELDITVKENKIIFYIQDKDKIKTINNHGVVTEKLDNLGDRKLVKLTGIDVSNKNVGEKILDGENLQVILGNFYNIIEVMPKEYSFIEINMQDLNNIICFTNNIKIMVGDASKLVDKMNMALNAIEQGVITKGYIDMSFDGNPVIKQID